MPPRRATPIQALLRQAVLLHQQGRFREVEQLARTILRQSPNQFDAVHLLGVVALETDRPKQATELLRRAVELKPDFAAAHANLANALLHQGEFLDALSSLDRALALGFVFPEIHLNRGSILERLGMREEALACYERALAQAPELPEAHYNRGKVLHDLRRCDDALASYAQALELRPGFVDAYLASGNALVDLGRHEEAVEVFGRAIEIDPRSAPAFYNQGNTFAALRRSSEAIAAFNAAIALQPAHADAWYNHGNVLRDMGEHIGAVTSYDRVIAAELNHLGARNNRGISLKALGCYEAALSDFQHVLSCHPGYPYVRGEILDTKLRICDWADLETQVADMVRRLEAGEKASPPFVSLVVSDSSIVHRQAAETFVREQFACGTPFPSIARSRRSDRPRIAYFSADFRVHPTANLTAELIETHDRERFEWFGFYFGPETNEAAHLRFANTFDTFINLNRQSDKSAARLAREMEIDIVVDLMGYTANSRPGIFANRAAPIQVSYLGYPGTMAAAFFDYLIADRTVIPADARSAFTEKIVFLPDTYQPNDTIGRTAAPPPTRANVGLPERDFVFCCFNNNFKILPAVFDTWMRILRRVEGSILWLLQDNDCAAANLCEQAELRGISPDRLIFAPRTSLPQHLARHECADLFLDTLPYNAHTTASDALWMGLPVLTLIGEAFPGRVAASLLRAIDMPDLVTTTLNDYEALAIDLAANPVKLAQVRQRLARNRATTPLFSTKRFARHIEAAYIAMYDRYLARLPPDHIEV